MKTKIKTAPRTKRVSKARYSVRITIEPAAKKKGKVIRGYLNIYRRLAGFGGGFQPGYTIYRSKKQADANADAGRVSCINLAALGVVEGMGVKP